eukprot:jgi/Mesvir1/16704/Mv15095-RA.1
MSEDYNKFYADSGYLPAIRTAREAVAAQVLSQGSERTKFGVILARNGMDGPAAELGLYSGKFAYAVLTSWNASSHYFVVEPYPSAGASALLDKADPDGVRVRRVPVFPTRAFSRFPNLYFDFVYLHSGHTYGDIMKDLEEWFPKMRAGGLMAGYNYCTTEEQRRLEPDKYANKPACFEDPMPSVRKPYNMVRPEIVQAAAPRGILGAVDAFAGDLKFNVSFTLEGRDPNRPWEGKGNANPSWFFFV